jgi:hypothetical protein
MVRLYAVYLKDKFIGYYRAFNETSAIEQAYMKTGSASLYTGSGRNDYEARKVW